MAWWREVSSRGGQLLLLVLNIIKIQGYMKTHIFCLSFYVFLFLFFLLFHFKCKILNAIDFMFPHPNKLMKMHLEMFLEIIF